MRRFAAVPLVVLLLAGCSAEPDAPEPTPPAETTEAEEITTREGATLESVWTALDCDGIVGPVEPEPPMLRQGSCELDGGEASFFEFATEDEARNSTGMIEKAEGQTLFLVENVLALARDPQAIIVLGSDSAYEVVI